jgi:arginyl-tRNA synthetase
MKILDRIQDQFRAALAGLTPDVEKYVAMVKPTANPQHGDYQANCAMSLAKELGQKPRDVAVQIAERLPPGEMLEKPEVAGPGFINLRLRKGWLAARLREMAGDERLGVQPAAAPRTVVIDYSSPNVAKPLHVGHLRSTIIGDALARLLRFLGHKVITDNHLGDWGLQFGMLLYGYKNFRDEAALKADPVREMLRLYLEVRERIGPAESVEEHPEMAGKYDPELLARSREALAACRQETARLHAGDADNVRLWQTFMPWCMEDLNAIYQRLDVHFDHMHGESYYNPMLPGVVDDLLSKGVAKVSEGAVAVFLEEEKPPALVRYRNGAFTYTTSDLATIRDRVQTCNPDEILYVVGVPQALHFKNLFAVARRWGYDRVRLEHIGFGSVLGSDRKLFRTREGGTIELAELLDEAVQRAGQVYEQSRAERRERNEEVPELTPEERRQVEEAVGLGAVKYADLSQNRTSDYVFSWDKMLAMNGNTATYMQYGYARTRAVFRKGDVDVAPLRSEPPLPSLEQPEERALGLKLLQLEETLAAAAAELQPHLITAYLWELSKSFSSFYQQCPVLKAETPELRSSRLLLCDLTGRAIQLCLSLLGIRTVERM